MTKVSICIPAYKQVQFLRVTLESIRSQQFTDYEVNITDDSLDDSVEQLVKEFPLDGRMRYCRNPKQLGSPENWNECIRSARGELIKIMHHDDHFTDADSLGSFVDMLDAHPEADFAFSATCVEDYATKLTRIHRPTEKQLATLGDRPQMLFAGNCIGAPSVTIYRRSMKIEYDREMKWLVDIDFYIRALELNSRFIYMSKPLIATPTNVPHQVTELCRDNADIELFEYYRLFSKLTPLQRDDKYVKVKWMHLFIKYGIHRSSDLRRYDVGQPHDAEYFRLLLKKIIKLRLLTLFYRLYPHLPSFIRAPIRWMRNRWSSLLGF